MATGTQTIHAKRGPGRPKGSPNKQTAHLRRAMSQALDDLGGHEYLVILAKEHPAIFAGLLAKALPPTAIALQAETAPASLGASNWRGLLAPQHHSSP